MATPQALLEYLTTTRIGEKGQLTIPKQFREDLSLGAGAPFAVLRLRDGLILLPEQQRFAHLCEQISSSLTAAGVTSKELLATLPEARKRTFERRYRATICVPPPPRLADVVRSERSPKAPPVPGLECPNGRNCLSVGTRQSRALSLCAVRICRLVFAEAVRDEVEENLLLHAGCLSSAEADELIANYRQLIKLTKPELVPYPGVDSVRANRHLIRHEADVPILLSAMEAKPDWLLTNNTKHFTQAAAQRTGLRIATPAEFFRTLSSLLQ